MRAKYGGVCVVTGQSYGPGTPIVKTDKGWAIQHPDKVTPRPDYRTLRDADGIEKSMDLNKPVYCRCVKTRAFYVEDKPETWEPCRMVRQGETLTCPLCRRTLTLLPRPVYKPEVKVCWECGCEFTYADCKRNGGDWSEDYCGC